MIGEIALGRNRAVGAAAAVATMALAAVPAVAQNTDYERGYAPDGVYTTEEMTVYAPRTVGRSRIGAPIREVSTSRVVYMADLDLNASWGVRELRHRVDRAARDACDELDARFPITAEDSPDCFTTAVRNGMIEAENLTGYDLAER